MTLAEFAAVLDGFGRFHGGPDNGEGAELKSAFLDALAAEAEAGRL